MINTILAYILSLILVPNISAFIEFPAMIFGRIIGSIVGSFTTIWLSVLIFDWFSVEIGWVFITLLALFIIQNDLYRIKTRKGPQINYLIGNLIGLVIGTIYFIW